LQGVLTSGLVGLDPSIRDAVEQLRLSAIGTLLHSPRRIN
jgi:ribosomal protein L30/L7E